jgi:DNA repair exonuclease SbcCD nuclease subunit
MSATLIVGDLHLGKGLSIGKPGIGNAINSRVADQVKLLDWTFDQALEHDVHTIIFTGDICEDPKPDYVLVNIFIQFLKKCEVNKMEVHIIAGNHDIKRTGNQYTSILDLLTSSELPNTHIYKQIDTIYQDGVCFTLLPFRDRRSFNCETSVQALEALAERLPYELADIPPNYDRVLIGHLALEGSLFVGDEVDDYANELMCPLSMFAGYHYVWMGHVHKPQVRSKKPYIAHIGSVDISDFGETDHKKILVLYDSNLPEKFKEIPIPTRPLRKFAVSVPLQVEPVDYILEQLATANQTQPFKDAIVKVEIKLMDAEAKNTNRAVLEKAIYDLGAFYICNMSETRNIAVVPVSKQNAVENTINPKAAVKLWAEQYKFDSEDDKTAYVNAAIDIINECASK